MSSHRKIQHKNTLRYHSEDSLGSLAKLKNREGACSIQDYYLKQRKNKNNTDFILNEEEIAIPEVKLLSAKDNLLTLPKIHPKTLHKPYRNLFAPKSTLPKQQAIFSAKKPTLSLTNSQYEQTQDDYISASHQGNRVKNEDRIAIHKFEVNEQQYQYFAVFDGHGGHLASTYLSNQFHMILKDVLSSGEQPQQALKSSFKIAEEKLKKNPRLSHKSGSCALVCLLSKGSCWIANIGDSRVISINTKSQVCQISRDHKPEDEVERKRIEYNGGEVYRQQGTLEDEGQNRKLPFRVYPGKLSVSRTIGDIFIKKDNPNIIISDPDIYQLNTKNLSFLLLFSDGLYQTLSNHQISNFFLSLKLQKAISDLFAQALKRKSQDNRSIIAIKLQ